MIFPINIKNEKNSIEDFCSDILGSFLSLEQKIIAETICNNIENLTPVEYLYMKSHSNFKEECNYSDRGFTLNRRGGKTHLMATFVAYEIWNLFCHSEEIPKEDKVIMFFNTTLQQNSHTQTLMLQYINAMKFNVSISRKEEICVDFRGQQIKIVFSSTHSRILRGTHPHMICYDNCFLYPLSFFDQQHQFYYDVKKRIFCGTSGYGEFSDIFIGLHLNF